MSEGLIQTCREYFRAAVAVGASAQSLLDISAATDDPTPTVVVGTNQRYGVLTFTDGQASYARLAVRLPPDWYVPGGLTARLLWSTPATSGSARWTVDTAYVMPIDGDQDDLDPAFNAEDVVLSPASAAADVLIKADFATLDLTNARAGALLFLRIGRDPADGDDDLGDDANLIGVELQYQRRMVLP
jgi:hypothetical protein